MSIKNIMALAGGIALAACSAIGEAKGKLQYQCGPKGDRNALVLPIPDDDVSRVMVRLQGREISATYETAGLTQYWIFEDSLYVELEPDFTAKYMDFRGAEPGEKRRPSSVFNCE